MKTESGPTLAGRSPDAFAMNVLFAARSWAWSSAWACASVCRH